jgi:hypothetical protein
LLDSDEEKRGQVANFVENTLVSLSKSGKLSIKKRRGRRPNKISRRRSAFESKNVLSPLGLLCARRFYRRSFRVSVSFPYFFVDDAFSRAAVSVVPTASAAVGGVLSSTRARSRAVRLSFPLFVDRRYELRS